MVQRKYYDYAKDAYFTTERNTKYDINKIRNNSVKPNTQIKRKDQVINNPKAKRKQILANKFLVGLISGIIVSTSLGVGFNVAKDAYTDSILNYKAGAHFAQYHYSTYSKEGYTMYNDDYTAKYVFTQTDYDPDTALYYIYDSYEYYPQRHMNEVIKNLSRMDSKNELGYKNIKSFEDYYKSLGYETEQDYRKEYSKVALNDIKKRAQINQENDAFPFSYDYESDSYGIKTVQTKKGR